MRTTKHHHRFPLRRCLQEQLSGTGGGGDALSGDGSPDSHGGADPDVSGAAGEGEETFKFLPAVGVLPVGGFGLDKGGLPLAPLHPTCP